MAEQTAAQQIADRLARREAQFKAWTLLDGPGEVEPGSDDAKALMAKATEFDWEEPEREEGHDDDEHVAAVVESAREYLTRKRDDDNADEGEVLGVSVKVTVELRVELSTGGPGDWLTAELDLEDGTISDVRYHFAPWFDHADVRVHDDSPLYALVERFASLCEGRDIRDLAGYPS